jgi:deazaflavin-dependent oxidoreductase (nitroreductase family)
MPIPKSVARLNRVVTNRATRLIASWMPGFGVVVHRGRRSGREYRTPVNVFRRPDGYVIALTYGADTDWTKNVLAASGCVLQVRRRRVRVGSPRVVHDEVRRDIPPVVRQILGLLRVTDFLYLVRDPDRPKR